MAWTPDFSLVGLQVAGDVGPVTVYTDRFFRKIWFPRSPPKEPPSAIQIWQRDRWRSAIAAYNALTIPEKANLAACCRKLSLQVTGPSLWLWLSFRSSPSQKQTLERQSGLLLPNP
jgi:hypothetical protein